MDVTADQAAGDAAATLDAVATAYWDAYLEANPEFATAIGDTRFDDILEDPTPEGAAATRARYTDVLARASRIAPDALDADGRITLAALRESAGSDIAQIDTGLDDWNLDPLEGVPASFLLIPDYQRLETAEDGRRMLLRWRAMATCTDRHLDSVRRSLADGRVACVGARRANGQDPRGAAPRRDHGLAAARTARRPRGPRRRVRLVDRGP